MLALEDHDNRDVWRRRPQLSGPAVPAVSHQHVTLHIPAHHCGYLLCRLPPSDHLSMRSCRYLSCVVISDRLSATQRTPSCLHASFIIRDDGTTTASARCRMSASTIISRYSTVSPR